MKPIYIQTEDIGARLYLSLVHDRLQSTNLLKNPFKGHIKHIGQGYFECLIEPIYPPFYYIGLIVMIATLLLFGLSYVLLIPVALTLPGIFYTRSMMYIAMMIGMSKARVANKPRLVWFKSEIASVMEKNREQSQKQSSKFDTVDVHNINYKYLR